MVNAVFDQRVAVIGRRVERAVERGEIPPVDADFLAELLAGPVHLHINRGLRPFTRADAERIIDVLLAGLRATAP